MINNAFSAFIAKCFGSETVQRHRRGATASAPGKNKELTKVVAGISKVTPSLRLIERLKVVASAGVTPSLSLSERLVAAKTPASALMKH